MVIVLSLGLAPSHHDYESLKRIEVKILEHAKGWERFKRDIPNLIRQGIDEVIDAARTMRFTLDELERIEKAYISTKLKILVSHHLKLERGKVLDVLVGGVEVGIANANGSRWLIPKVAIGHPYIFIKHDEKAARCSLGLAVITASLIVKGLARNRGNTTAGQPLIPVLWMLRDEPYPRNPWEDICADNPTRLDYPPGRGF